MITGLLLAFLLASATSREVQTNDLNDIFDAVWDILNALRMTIKLPDDAGLNITQLLTKYNYPVEEHTVVTEDEYTLSLFRIPTGRADTNNLSKPPVFLMHGLLSSATDFCNMGPKKSLAMILADAGFDVWLGNSRGNKLSRKHVTLDPDRNSSYWDFSFHEKGIYDLPASIDYVLNVTGLPSLSYIGHSEGTTDFFAMGSEKPEYNSKIDIAIALAPIAYMENVTSPLVRLMVDYMTTLKLIADVVGIHELPSSRWLSLLGDLMCNDESDFQCNCAMLFEILVGDDIEQFNLSTIPIILSNAPAGISLRQLEHYGQMIRSARFQKYDYGLANILHYGQFTPPSYNTSKISAPMAIFYAQNDAFAATINVEQLISELPDLKEAILIQYASFNHLDFLWAIDVKELLYDKVIDTLKKYVTVNSNISRK
ncbi:lipase 3-like [Cylas formicarius]|uniref:lipase 3-like n=1 Tax=Cylas formicarius TaxID=197179 RepID=UPI002958CCFA|nr:lipase 3-like [Cylas formicarius]